MIYYLLSIIAVAFVAAAYQHILLKSPETSRLPDWMFNNYPGIIDPFHVSQGLTMALVFLLGRYSHDLISYRYLPFLWWYYYFIRDIFYHSVLKQMREWPQWFVLNLLLDILGWIGFQFWRFLYWLWRAILRGF